MVGPFAVLAADPAAVTSKVEDVDGGPTGGCRRQGAAVAAAEVEDVDGGPSGGCWRQGPTAATTEVEDVDGGPPGGAEAGDPGAQHLRSPPLGQGGEWLQKPRINAQRVVRTHFTLTQVGHFY
jgi:hypothetical protein